MKNSKESEIKDIDRRVKTARRMGNTADLIELLKQQWQLAESLLTEPDPLSEYHGKIVFPMNDGPEVRDDFPDNLLGPPPVIFGVGSGIGRTVEEEKYSKPVAFC